MTRPAVSVLIPAYNAASYVGDALQSVMAQTFEAWEVVAVDDRSSDRTRDVLDEYAKKDARIRPFTNDTNVGMTANWNRCLAHAEADLVLKLDADDALRPRTLELLASALESREIVGAGVRTVLCDASLKPFGVLPADDAMRRAGIDPLEDRVDETRNWYVVAAHGNQLWHSCAVMFRRSFLEAAGGWDERFGCASDSEVIWRLLEQPGRFAHFGYEGVLYRIVEGSVSTTFRKNDWLRWEGTAANILTLGRARARATLPWGLRTWHADLHEKWTGAVSERVRLPAAIVAKLESVVGSVPPPPLLDRLLWRLRTWLPFR